MNTSRLHLQIADPPDHFFPALDGTRPDLAPVDDLRSAAQIREQRAAALRAHPASATNWRARCEAARDMARAIQHNNLDNHPASRAVWDAMQSVVDRLDGAA
jgi:hypothetical protein